MCPPTGVRRPKAVELGVEKAAWQYGDVLGAEAIHPRTATSSVSTRLPGCQYTASYVRSGGNECHAPCAAKQLGKRQSKSVSTADPSKIMSIAQTIKARLRATPTYRYLDREIRM